MQGLKKLLEWLNLVESELHQANIECDAEKLTDRKVGFMIGELQAVGKIKHKVMQMIGER